jgi:hypothetical protein
MAEGKRTAGPGSIMQSDQTERFGRYLESGTVTEHRKRTLAVDRANTEQFAQRREVLALTFGHVLGQVVEVERHEGIHLLIGLEQPISGHPASRRGGREKILRRYESALHSFRHSTGRKGKAQNRGHGKLSRDEQWSNHDVPLSSEHGE